jgi:ATP-dependent RNA helicase RhlE
MQNDTPPQENAPDHTAANTEEKTVENTADGSAASALKPTGKFIVKARAEPAEGEVSASAGSFADGTLASEKSAEKIADKPARAPSRGPQANSPERMAEMRSQQELEEAARRSAALVAEKEEEIRLKKEAKAQAEYLAANPPPPPEPQVPWDTLGLTQPLLDLIQKAGFNYPTPVQAKAIPHALKNMDLICSAQTGTGKTAAFVFPIIEQVVGRNGTYALVLAPTREIATQTQMVLEQFGTPLGIRSCALIGGTDIKADEKALREYPQVIVATPGRMVDHLERGNIWLEFLETLVLDEADRMLEMGFADQLNRILAETPNTRQTLLFSATLSPTVEKLAQKILYEPIRIQVGQASRAAHTVDQRFVFIEEDSKLRELEHLLYEERGTVFIFARSKDSAARLWRSLRNRGFHEATQLHSDLEQNVREEALQDFKDGKYRVLIATDVVGRGIHVEGVAHVINYDIPRDGEDYVHRIGRTGRAESSGKATTLITPRDMLALAKIEKVIGKKIPRQTPRR